jgi:hypothetical protein
MPRGHTANELRHICDILAADGTTVLASSVRNGLEDLVGKRLEQAQLVSAETSHTILLHTGDADTLTESGYIRCEGVLYIVDYKMDPRVPRPGMWTEVYCHVERTAA